MHIGAYDDEPVTVDAMHRFMEEQGYTLDITDRRMHHEIYLSDARKVAPERWFESYSFYPKHGYAEYEPRYMRKKL